LASFRIILVMIKEWLCEFRKFKEPVIFIDELDWLAVNGTEFFSICINEIAR